MTPKNKQKKTLQEKHASSLHEYLLQVEEQERSRRLPLSFVPLRRVCHCGSSMKLHSVDKRLYWLGDSCSHGVRP
jgi:hypothetical protein